VAVHHLRCVCLWRPAGGALLPAGQHRPHLEQWLGLIVTSVLLVSSFFMNRAEVQISQGNRQGFIRSTIITMVLGIIFLVGVVGVEWQLSALWPG
jgi:cytochrome c oxidase subunit III